MPDNPGWLKDLLDKRWIALAVLGALLLLLAAGKGAYGLKLEDLGWRIVIAILGVGVIGFGIWDGMRTADSDSVDRDLKKHYGFSITSPNDNANVANEFQLEGMYETKPPDDLEIRFFVRSTHGDYWPSAQSVMYNEVAKRWSITIKLGGTLQERKLVGLAGVGRNSALICRYYDHVLARIMGLRQQYNAGNAEIGVPGIPRMPADWTEGPVIWVCRSS